ncbi:MAG: hypothetical protein ANABAC_3660 [Anaerolineae bacterium]|nr:MAG: hypothetical protein ANABAC_3660 [Anaerolineae bacterium]
MENALKRDLRPAVRQRYATIRLLHLGYKPAQVAEIKR